MEEREQADLGAPSPLHATPDGVTSCGQEDESPAAPSIYRGFVPPESTTSKDVEGEDLSSLSEGFDFLGMPSNRRAVARSLVEEIAARNSVESFHWYKPSGSNHVVCYWNASDVNLLWITTGHVQIRSDGPVVRPDRRLDWSSADGAFVGWTLPGFVPGDASTGGSSRHRVDTVSCPHHRAPPQPVGAECPECCVIHEAVGDQVLIRGRASASRIAMAGASARTDERCTDVVDQSLL